MKHARTVVAALIAAGLLVSCSSESEPESLASETTSAPASTSTTVEATTTTEVSHLEADLALIVEHHREKSTVSLNQSEAALFEFLAERAYPEGAWTAEDISCFERENISDELGYMPTHDEHMQNLDDFNPIAQWIVDQDTIEETPDWVIPAPGPSAGEVPDGRVYIVASHYEAGVADRYDESHFTVIDGKVFYFPVPCNDGGGEV